jgi:EGF-like domain
VNTKLVAVVPPAFRRDHRRMRWAQACMASAILAVAACGDNVVPFCDSQPCLNGATCAEGESGPVCACAPGYEGAVCETNIDECASMPCQNGGVCTDGIDAYTCACAAGFEGPTCATNTDDCAPNPCLNGGACTDGVDAFTCACAAAFEGDRCQCALTGPFTLDYTNRGTSTTAMITDSPPGVIVTSAGTIQILNLNGLGVVGGASDSSVDGSEHLDVTLTNPARAVSYFVGFASNLDGDGQVGEATIEAFDAAGGSLGVRATANGGVKDVTALFAGARIKRFIVRADVDGFRVGNITVSPVVCP